MHTTEDGGSVSVGLSLKRKPPMRTVYSKAPSALPSAASARWSGQSRSVRAMHPQYSLGSVEYQRNRKAKGRTLLLSLVSVVENAPDGTEIIDAAGDFLIQRGEYADGLELYRAAVQRFPDVGVFHQGRGCRAAHEGEFREAVAASRRALAIEPDNQKFDLGWCLAESGALQEALATLERAVAMDPADELAKENLRLCNLKIAKRRRKKAG